MSTTSLTLSERGGIYELRKFGLSIGDIALRLHRSKSTVDTELRRTTPYNPEQAQHNAVKKRCHCGRHSTLTGAEASQIENNLEKHWSPEAIAHQFHYGLSTIYGWIKNHRLHISLRLLPEKGHRAKRKHERRGRFPIIHTIEDRPESVNNRTSFGNWEVDTVLSSRGESKACLATFVERKTRLLWVRRIHNRTHQSLARAMKEFMKHFRPTVKSITTDHGREFSYNWLLEKIYKIPFYFCHPYSPQERGTNERMNRRVREFFPKKTNFNQISQSEVMDATYSIDTRPMKVLNWRTAIQEFRDELFKLKRSD